MDVIIPSKSSLFQFQLQHLFLSLPVRIVSALLQSTQQGVTLLRGKQSNMLSSWKEKLSCSYEANRMTHYRTGKKNCIGPTGQTERHIIELERKSHSYRAQQSDTSLSWKEKLTDVMIMMMMMMTMMCIHNGSNRMTC